MAVVIANPVQRPGKCAAPEGNPIAMDKSLPDYRQSNG
jgi:hypothetical protein